MAKRPNINPMLVSLLKEKASHSDCTYKISAIAFDKKGNVLGHVTNKHSTWDVLVKKKMELAGPEQQSMLNVFSCSDIKGLSRLS